MEEKRDNLRLFAPRPAAVAALGTAGGVFGALSAPDATVRLAVTLAAAFLCVAARSLRRRAFALLFLFFTAAALSASLAAPRRLPTGTALLSGRVAEAPLAATPGAYRLVLDGSTLGDAPVDGRVQAVLPMVIPPVYGQRVAFAADVFLPDEPYAGALSARRVFLLAVPVSDDYTLSMPPERPGLYGRLLSLRAGVAARIDALFPARGGAARGMLLGDKAGMDEGTLAIFRAAGLSHLFAVSGLHTTVLAGAVYLLLRPCGSWTRFGLLALFLLGFSALTAFSASVVRAAVMCLLAALGEPLLRRNDPVSALSAAAVLILLAAPYQLYSAGFQLSFTACLGIVLLAPILRDRLSRLGSMAAGGVAATLSASVGTLPVMLGVFGEIPVASLSANLIALPLFPLFMAPAALALLVSLVSLPAARALAILPDTALRMLLAIADGAGSRALLVPPPSLIASLCWLIAIPFASRLCLKKPVERALLTAFTVILSLLTWRI